MARTSTSGKNPPKPTAQLKAAPRRATAVIRGGLSDPGFSEEGPIATKREIDMRLTALMRGQFDRFPALGGLQPNSKMLGMLKAIELLMKRFGMFQDPSQNEADRIARVEQLKRAAASIIQEAAATGPEPTPDEVMAVLIRLEPEFAQHAPEALASLKEALNGAA